jgi:phage terminase small subunit
MGKMSHAQIVASLTADNPRAKLAEINLYAESFQQWQEATENIREHGAICAHPRTGQPMPNPYLVVQTAALKNLQRFARLRTDSLWRLDSDAQTVTANDGEKEGEDDHA